MRYLMFLFLVACSPVIYSNYSVDSELQPFVDAFVRSGAMNGLVIRIPRLQASLVSQSSLRPNELGVCILSNNVPVIKIARESWQSMTPWDRREVVFHELGHCVLGILKHDDSTKNLMNTYHLGPKWYNEKTFFSMEQAFFSKVL